MLLKGREKGELKLRAVHTENKKKKKSEKKDQNFFKIFNSNL